MVVSTMYFVTIPIALLLLHLGMTLVIVYVVKITCQIAETIYSAKYLAKIVNFNIKPFARNSALSCLFMLIGLLFPLSITSFLEMNSILSAIINTVLGEAIFIVAVWKWGLTKLQQIKIKQYVSKKMRIEL